MQETNLTLGDVTSVNSALMNGSARCALLFPPRDKQYSSMLQGELLADTGVSAEKSKQSLLAKYLSESAKK